MTIGRGMTLYHGSYALVEKPDLKLCHEGKDFGRGFYLTTDFEQAKRFTKMSIRKALRYGLIKSAPKEGYVSEFQLNSCEDLTSFVFEEANSDWLHCVAAHRKRGSIPGEEEKWRCFDIIAGKIANDRTNAVIAAYIGGVYGEVGSAEADRVAISLLEPDNLKDQLCFRTESAIEALEYVGYEVVSNE